jgi:hypothetical protein
MKAIEAERAPLWTATKPPEQSLARQSRYGYHKGLKFLGFSRCRFVNDSDDFAFNVSRQIIRMLLASNEDVRSPWTAGRVSG